MQDLRLIGVHEDGHHLLLADADGGRYRLTLDEALRAAARRDRPRLGQLQIEIEGGLRPREVQALIRRGLSTEEVAERAGWTVEKVRRFEGPVLAEREHVARVAQQCAVGSRGTGPETLADRVGERLRDRGVERDDAEWDSSRDEEGTWTLTMTFPAGGRQRTATWRYEPLGGAVTPSNDEARWLSEESVGSAAIPTPHTAPTSGDHDVYDVDADGGVGRSPRARGAHEPIDLMAAMREHSTRGRRGRSRRPSPATTPGDDEPRPDALPIEDLAVDPADAPPPPASRGRNPLSAHLEAPSSSEQLVGGFSEDDAAAGAVESPAALEAVPPRADPADDHPAEASSPAGSDDAGAADVDAPARRPTPGRKGRPSVPSWDDIVFGTRGGS
ncbi:septation protein SepH [Oryzobacter sp. R7]|uniref:septation protein SepH n=1 Tax=Oryzobacter faecalis TaxID=3388656 RepID=UPI00398D51EB